MHTELLGQATHSFSIVLKILPLYFSREITVVRDAQTVVPKGADKPGEHG